MTDSKRLSDEDAREWLRAAHAVVGGAHSNRRPIAARVVELAQAYLARGRELEELRSFHAILEAIKGVLADEGFDVETQRSGIGWGAADVRKIVSILKARVRTLEAENAALRRLRSVVLTLIERVEEEQSQPHTSPMVFVDALEPLRAALNNARASGEGEDKP